MKNRVHTVLIFTSIIFMGIWFFSYYYGQKDTGRVFGVLGFLLSACSILLDDSPKVTRYLLFVIKVATAAIVFLAAQQLYGTN